MPPERSALHVAIIPDGNRRWARARGLAGTAGHKAAMRRERVVSLLDEAQRLGVGYFSLWAFSTENWKRSRAEREGLFALFADALGSIGDDLRERKIAFRWLGRRERVPASLRGTLEALERETSRNAGMAFLLCLDYGGRDEIVRAVNRALKARMREVDEKGFAALLDTAGTPDPSLIIRTGGELRLSGFFAFQGAYAELVFTKRQFPAFGPRDLRAAVAALSRRERRFGR